MSPSQLTVLLSSPSFLLPYTLPLLFISLALAFAGTFLTLDRSRSFPAHGSVYTSVGLDRPPPKTSGWTWTLEGGIGGIAIGYSFGLQLATFLSLLIPATSSAKSLSSAAFLAIWIIFSLITTPLAARYRLVALFFSTILGGALTSMALMIILHPSLLPRIVLISTLTALFPLIVLFSGLFFPRFLHPTLRFCTSSTGAFGVVVSIALLLQLHSKSDSSPESWANPWERLWLRDGAGWGTSREQGLSAAYCIFVVAGMAIDWTLRHWIGECPDEKWDEYLAKYTANLPIDPDRAGTFVPHMSFWDRFFTHRKNGHEHDLQIPEPEAGDDKSIPSTPLLSSLPSYSSDLPTLHNIPRAIEIPKKTRGDRPVTKQNQRSANGRRRIKFKPAHDDSSDSDSDSERGMKKSRMDRSHESVSTPSSSTPTLVNAGRTGYGNNKSKWSTEDLELDVVVSGKLPADEDYSDFEEGDVGRVGLKQSQDHSASKQDGWAPGFIKRHQSHRAAAAAGNRRALGHASRNNSADGGFKPRKSSPLAVEVEGVSAPVPVTTPVPVAAPVPVVAPVAATPSLLQAMARIATAQREAFGIGRTASSGAREGDILRSPKRPIRRDGDENGGRRSGEVGGLEAERAPRWEDFWREVRAKAQS